MRSRPRAGLQAMLVGAALAAAVGVANGQEAAVPVNGNDLPVKEFLELVRYPQFLNAWARLRGQAHHKAGDRDVKVPIELRARFKPTEWRMQVIVNDAERWLVRQIPADGPVGTTKILQRPAPAGGVSLTGLMIQPNDITLSFLYFTFEQELDRETVSTRRCRVLQLADLPRGERVRVWLDTEAFFPLRVQKFKVGEAAPYLQLDFKGVVEVKSTVNPKTKILLVSEVVIANPGWKTRLKFDKDGVTGDEIDATHPVPADLFVEDAPPPEPAPAPPVAP